MPFTKNIHAADYEEGHNPKTGRHWSQLDLSGERLGVKMEELRPGEVSSIHHFHTAEEEHVLVMEGEATLILGSESSQISRGDHYWFPAGLEQAHHIENTSDLVFRFLVFGERNSNDVVVYPEHQVMLVKALDSGPLTYRDLKTSEKEDGHE